MGLLRRLVGRGWSSTAGPRPDLLAVRLRRLTRAYRGVLGLFVEATEMQAEGAAPEPGLVVSMVERAFRMGYEASFHANALAGEQWLDAYSRLDELKARSKRLFTSEGAGGGAPLLVPVVGIDESLRQTVGELVWTYGEAGRSLGVPVADGFVITPAAWRLAAGDADPDPGPDRATTVGGLGAGRGDRGDDEGPTAPLTRRGLEQALVAAFTRLGGEAWSARFLVQSADQGQREAELIVLEGGASAAAEAVLARGVEIMSGAGAASRPAGPEGAPLIAAVCTPVVQADLSGSLFSVDPASPFAGRMRLEIDHGPEEGVAWLSRTPPFAALPTSDEGAARQVAGWPALQQISRLAGRIERYCGARELEWSVTREGRLVITWLRPLQTQASPAVTPELLTAARQRYPALLRGRGEAVFPGVAYGRVFLARDEEALAACPDHAVVVVRRLELGAGLLSALRRAAAVISEGGRGIDRAASLVRALRVPALVGVSGALDALPEGELVTVDVGERVVYAGFFADLFHHYLLRERAASEAPELARLNLAVRDLGSPLAVVEPTSADPHGSLCGLVQTLFDGTLRRLAALPLASSGERDSRLPAGVAMVGGNGAVTSPGEAGRSPGGSSPADAFLVGLSGARGGAAEWRRGAQGYLLPGPEDVLALIGAGDRVVAIDARVSARRSTGHLMFWCDVGGESRPGGAPLRQIRRQAMRFGLDSLRFAGSVVAWRDPLPAGSHRDRLMGLGELAAWVLGRADEAQGTGVS